MTIKFTCPQCRATLTADESKAGHVAICHECSAKVPIPKADPAKSKPMPASAVTPQPAKSSSPIPSAMTAPPLPLSRRTMALGLVGLVLLLGTLPFMGLGLAWVYRGEEKKVQVPPTPPSDPEPPAVSENEKDINLAIHHGTVYLKSRLLDEKAPALETGTAALMGLAVVEGDTSLNVAVVKRVLGILHKNKDGLTGSYSIATSLFFLNRLNEISTPHRSGALEEADKQLIRTLALRLIAGQTPSGRWSYVCPRISEKDEVELLRRLREGQYQPTGGVIGHTGNLTDNSITQFAMLSLWGATNSVPVRAPLFKAAVQFHNTQMADGGWSYVPEHQNNDLGDSNTCAGLLGLAIEKALRDGKGFASDPAPLPKPRFDEIRQKGFNRLGGAIGWTLKHPPRGGNPTYHGKLFRAAAYGDIYFLWCVERVAVIHEAQLIGGKDWYQWGSQVLLEAQNKENGSWADKYDPVIDTSFAILFLRRANLAKDLTIRLRQMGEADDDAALKIAPGAKKEPKRRLFN